MAPEPAVKASEKRMEPKTESTVISLDGAPYRVEVLRRRFLPPEAPRLVIVSHVTNPVARILLSICLTTVESFTPEPHELWVIDNNSPREHIEWLLQWPDLNVALNRTEPLPSEARAAEIPGPARQREWGSYANAVGLEIATRLVDASSQYLMTMHMDVMPCRTGWLSFLLSKLRDGTAAAGVRMDKTRGPEGVLHVLGFVVDFHLFKQLHLDFFPDLPNFDVGDRITIELRKAGFAVYACPNTIWEPELQNQIPSDSPLRTFRVDRSFDDRGNVIFLHLGRGTRKSDGEHSRGTSVEEWAALAAELRLWASEPSQLASD